MSCGKKWLLISKCVRCEPGKRWRWRVVAWLWPMQVYWAHTSIITPAAARKRGGVKAGRTGLSVCDITIGFFVSSRRETVVRPALTMCLRSLSVSPCLSPLCVLFCFLPISKSWFRLFPPFIISAWKRWRQSFWSFASYSHARNVSEQFTGLRHMASSVYITYFGIL